LKAAIINMDGATAAIYTIFDYNLCSIHLEIKLHNVMLDCQDCASAIGLPDG
jgi:hypothetical protein